MKCVAHDGLHRVLADRFDQPIALGRSLQFVDRLVQVEFARGPEFNTCPATQFESLECINAGGDNRMAQRGGHDVRPRNRHHASKQASARSRQRSLAGLVMNEALRKLLAQQVEHRERSGIVPPQGGSLRRGGWEAIVAGRLAWF
jgi:hypothetical protein